MTAPENRNPDDDNDEAVGNLGALAAASGDRDDAPEEADPLGPLNAVTTDDD